MNTILLIDDDMIFHEMIKAYLPEHQIISTYSGEEGIEYTKDNCPDLILVDIQMEGIDGYETTRQLRTNDALNDTPIVFISTLNSDEDRMKAYGIGAYDYFSKPFNKTEFESKINQILTYREKINSSKDQLNESYQLFTHIQKNTSLHNHISRFSQLGQHCPDIDTLLMLFFYTVKEIKVNCVLKINDSEGIKLHSNSGKVSKLENEILEYASKLDRIHQFGDQRAIFNWQHSVLLVKNVGDLIDLVPLLLDAFDSAYASIVDRNKLLNNIHHLESTKATIKEDIKGLFSNLSGELSDKLTTLGLISSLDFDEEEQLRNLIDTYYQQINNKLDTLDQSTIEVLNNINALKEVPEELQKILISSQQVNKDVLFFN